MSWQICCKQIQNFAFTVGQFNNFKKRLDICRAPVFAGSFDAQDSLLEFARQFFDDVSPMLYELRSVLDQKIRPEGGLRRNVAGDCKDLASLLVSQTSCNQRSA